jgi:putative tryptophan/tyrosine transport system substrate-binding protein
VSGLGAREAKQASRTIPTVVVIEPDPVGSGLIESLSHPGGNVTGLSLMAVDLSGKRLGLLKEAVPNLSRVALIIDPKEVASQRIVSAFFAAAKTLDLDLRSAEVSSPAEIDQALAKIAADNIDGIIIGPGSMMFNERARIGAFALKQKIPMEVVVAEMVPFGPLLSYGPDFPDFFRRAVAYTDKILKGAKPADLPIEQPTRFKLVVNLKTGKALGLTVPNSLLINADEVIE